MNTPALEINYLTKRYGKLPVLESLSLSVQRGECFGLVGMNGAGKTTLIKCLLDFCDIDGGDIRILDVPHRETRARRPLALRRMRRAFQAAAIPIGTKSS